MQAAEKGGAAPTVLNAANEIAVAAFLQGQLPFTEIARVIEQCLSKSVPDTASGLDDVLNIDHEARQAAERYIHSLNR